ncbi:MAG: response regulator [Desulfocurvibacter africanus]
MTDSTRILIVDDDPLSLVAFGAMLEKHFPVDTANGPTQALERLEAHPPYAVVISDMYMPGMDGIDFLAEAGRLSPSTVKIMLTGHADLETAMAAVNKGHVFGFFSKTCQPQALVTAVRKAVAEHHKHGARPGRPFSKGKLLTREEFDFLTSQ